MGRAGTLVYQSGTPKKRCSIEEGNWLSEASLWTPWVHHGEARAVNECILVALDAERFHDVVWHNHAATASLSRYAYLFVDHFNSLAFEELSDLVDSSFDIMRAVDVAWMETEDEELLIEESLPLPPILTPA